MATIRIPSDQWAKTHSHLYTKPGEHFAFLLATWSLAIEQPVFVVKEALLVPDAEVEISKSGWLLSNSAITAVINAAVKTGCSLIEVHNHGGQMPRFSGTDRMGFREFVPYVLDSLRGRPYGATVWGDDTIYAEYFMPNGKTGVVDSVVLYGDKLDQAVSRGDDDRGTPMRFNRQLPWFTAIGQRKISRLKFGIVGLGGTGSPLVQNLVFLGSRDFVLVVRSSNIVTQ